MNKVYFLISYKTIFVYCIPKQLKNYGIYRSINNCVADTNALRRYVVLDKSSSYIVNIKYNINEPIHNF